MANPEQKVKSYVLGIIGGNLEHVASGNGVFWERLMVPGSYHFANHKMNRV